MILITLVSALISISVRLDLSIASKLKPDAYNLGGFLYQIIGRTFRSVQTGSLTSALIFAAALWFTNRYLFHRAKYLKVGEYLSCAFFTLAMLFSTSIRQTGSIQTLYENGFQVIKTFLFVGGMYPLLLSAVRGLNELLHRPQSTMTYSIWDRHPFSFPLIILSCAWIGQVIIKYPGVINLDEVMPIRQYIGLTPRSTDFPVMGTMIYGMAYTIGQRIGNINIPYFIIMLMQVVSLICVLSYALWLMKVKKVPNWIQTVSLVLFSVSPIYIGWVVAISKDSQYMVLLILMGVLLIDFMSDTEAFLHKCSRWLLLFLCSSLIVFTRYNGVYIVAIVFGALIFVQAKRHIRRTVIIRFVATACMVIAMYAGVTSAIINALSIQRIKFYDWLSIPFQQTARVAKLHGDDISQQEKDDISTMIEYDLLASNYTPNRVDPVKMTVSVTERGRNEPDRYLRVWWTQFKQYPMDYIDAMLNVNHYMFDLQINVPVYNSYSDIAEYSYPYAFHETQFFNLDEIRPLLSAQLALTEWYFRFSEIPVIGWFSSMGFCVYIMIAMAYLAWVNGRKATLIVMIPSILTAFTGMFCPEVYIRYLLPTIGSLPLWFAAYSICESRGQDHRCETSQKVQQDRRAQPSQQYPA